MCREVLAVYLTGGPTYFIELKILPPFCYFLSQEIGHILGGLHISERNFFAISGSKNIHSNLFSATYDVRKKCCFLTGILGVKFQTRVFFGGLEYEALLQPSPQSSIL